MRRDETTVLKIAHVMIEFYGSKAATLECERRARLAAKKGDDTQYLLWTLVSEALPTIAESTPEQRTVH